MWRLLRPILVFWLMGLSVLVSKISFFVIIVIGDLIQVFVFLLWWPVAVLVIPSRRIGYINPSGWSRAWKSWAARATMITASFIAPIVFMVLPRSIQGLGVFRALRRLRSKLLKSRRVPVEDLLFGAFVCLGGRLMALKIVSIYFSDLRRKVEGRFSLCGNSLLNGLLLGVFLTAILLSLSINEKP